MTRVVVLADDLIWATRLRSLVAAADAVPLPVRSAPSMAEALGLADGQRFAIVDMTARGYDPIAAVSAAAGAGATVLAVGQHDAVDQRRAALEAGAIRFVPYRRLADDGEATIRGWLAGSASLAHRSASAEPEEG